MQQPAESRSPNFRPPQVKKPASPPPDLAALGLSVASATAIIPGDSRTELAKFPDETFQCCVTSPPYWGMRDYGVTGQIGAEEKVEDYVADLVKIFSEVRRVLRSDGTLWLNLGNTYSSGGRTWRQQDDKNKGRFMSYRPDTPEGLKPKDLIGIAWMVAMALQRDGWYLRSDIIWYKPNCQPESVKDRVTQSHEYLFMLTKSETYIFDQEAFLRPEIGDDYRVFSIGSCLLRKAHRWGKFEKVRLSLVNDLHLFCR